MCRKRFAMWGWLVALASLGLTGWCPSSCAAEDKLAELLSQYRAHDLPFPPANARLVVRSHWMETIDDEPIREFDLAFLVRPRRTGGGMTFWFGCEQMTDSSPRVHREAEPAADWVDKTQPALEPSFIGFWPFPDLALAIQVKARGGDELAERLLERSRRTTPAYRFRVTPSRPNDDSSALAALAWNYWCNQFATSKEDRRAIVDRLQGLLTGPYELNNQVRRNIVADMLETLERRRESPSRFEAAIDSLTDLEVTSHWPTYSPPFMNSMMWRIERYPAIQMLRNAGLEAVPTLSEHLHDHRLTRSLSSYDNGRYTWHVRVSDVVAVLLDDLNPDGFAFDFARMEGRGRRLDETHVWDWWTNLQRQPEVDYLLRQAFRSKPDGRLTVHEGPLRALGRQFPDRFAEVFTERLGDIGSQAEFLLSALAASRLDAGEKRRLYLLAIESGEARARLAGLRYLLPTGDPEAVPLLVRELERLPHTPSEPYWLSASRQFPDLVVSANDDRAWEELVRTARRVDMGQRLELIKGLARCARKNRPRVMESLTLFLDDPESRTRRSLTDVDGLDGDESMSAMLDELFSGPSAGFYFDTLSVRDFAALQLARLLDLEVDEESLTDSKEWAELRARVQGALSEE